MKSKFFVLVAILMVVSSGQAFPQDMTQFHLPGISLAPSPHQGYLGVQLRDITASEVDHLSLSQEAGVFIVRVEKDSPAAQAALREGDVIIQFGSVLVFSVRQFQRLVSETPVGRQLELVFIRDGQRTSTDVILDPNRPGQQFGYLGRVPGQVRDLPDVFRAAPDRDGRPLNPPRLGIRGQEVAEQLGETLGVPGKRGVLVMEVTPGSPAQKAGIQAGDVIISVSGHPVSTVSELSGYLESESVELEIIRDQRQVEMTVQMGSEEDQDNETMRL
jgi:serine protease Do